MPNFPPITGYPFGLNDPLGHAGVNNISEAIQKAHNADEGSDHAPTGTSTWSGVEGFGFAFADAFPFTGEISVDGDGLTIDAATFGFVSFSSTVAVDIFGPTTMKGTSTTSHNSGSTDTYLSGSTVTIASGATLNITGQATVRGQLTIKASGGPGNIAIESGTTNTVAGIFNFLSGGELRMATGSEITGQVAITGGSSAFTLKDSLDVTLDPPRTWTRRARSVGATTYAGGAPQAVADKFSPLHSAPSLYVVAGSTNPVTTIFEFKPPPSGALLVTVTVKSVYGGNPLAALAVATYELVRYQRGLTADAVSLSAVTNDTHATDASDWNTVKTITISVNADTYADNSYSYGLRVTSSYLTGTSARLDMYFDIEITGTNNTLNGK